MLYELSHRMKIVASIRSLASAGSSKRDPTKVLQYNFGFLKQCHGANLDLIEMSCKILCYSADSLTVD